jgi:hypothetical protein
MLLAEIEPNERDDELILEYRLACASLRKIAEHFNITTHVVNRALRRALGLPSDVDAASVDKEIEIAMLNRIQRVVWPEALKGNIEAAEIVLKLSHQRSRLRNHYVANVNLMLPHAEPAPNSTQELAAAIDRLCGGPALPQLPDKSH